MKKYFYQRFKKPYMNQWFVKKDGVTVPKRYRANQLECIGFGRVPVRHAPARCGPC
jgi:hypothetical protein